MFAVNNQRLKKLLGINQCNHSYMPMSHLCHFAISSIPIGRLSACDTFQRWQRFIGQRKQIAKIWLYYLCINFSTIQNNYHRLTVKVIYISLVYCYLFLKCFMNNRMTFISRPLHSIYPTLTVNPELATSGSLGGKMCMMTINSRITIRLSG